METDQKSNSNHNNDLGDLGLVLIGIAMFMFIAPVLVMLMLKVGLGDVPDMIFKIGMWSIAFSFMIGVIGLFLATVVDNSTRKEC